MDAFDRANATREELDFLDNLAPVAASARRALRMSALLESGSAPSLQLRLAEFGTHTPGGLNLKPVDDTVLVPLNVMRGRANKKGNLGEATRDGQIFINKSLAPQRNPQSGSLVINHDMALVLSHEFAHRLQFQQVNDFGYNPAMNQTFMRPALAIPLPQTFTGILGYLSTKFRRAMAGYERADRSDSPKTKLMQIFGLNAKSTGRYLIRDEEVQARMHEILITGHSVWGKMPVTRTELYAAFYCAGLKLDGETLHDLLATEEGRSALREFHLPNPIKVCLKRPVTDLNDVINYAAAVTARDRLWKHAIPSLYGNMLEMYGDTLGRERMGLGPNQTQTLKVIGLLRKKDGIDDAALWSAVDDVAPDNVPELMCSLMTEKWPENVKHTYIPEILDKLLRKPDCRDTLLRPRAHPAHAGPVSDPAIIYSMFYGHLACTQKLLMAGADIFEVAERHDAVTGAIHRQAPIDLAFMLDDFKAVFGKTSKDYLDLHQSVVHLNAIYRGDRDEKRPLPHLQEPGDTELFSFNDVMRHAGLIPPQHIKTEKIPVLQPPA